MTILFLEDWQRYPGAAPDWDTKNQSFIEMALLYRELGVKNFAFPLALVDQSLKGVDPFGKDLTADQAIRVGIECKKNFWYFIREIGRDPAGSVEDPIQFNANRGIMSAFWLYFNHILTILIMIRQTGKSFGIDWLVTYLLNCRLTKSEISYLTKDEKLRGRELERLKGMELTLPPYMKQRSSRDPGSTEGLRVGRLENTFKPYVPNQSAKAADLIGRGMTAGTTIVDEFAYIYNNNITIPVMLSATLAAREVARKKNEPYGTIFMTTTGKRDTKEGKYAFKFVNDAAVWTEAWLDCKNLEDLERTIRLASPEKKLWVNCTFNHRQLGKDDEWLQKRLEEAAQEDPIQMRADYFNDWPSGTATSPFTPELAEAMRNSEVTDYQTELAPPEGYALRWYYPENIRAIQMEEPHILSMDPSEAVGRDAIGITLTRVSTGEVAMASDVSEGNLINFCRWLCDFLVQYKNVTLMIERKSTGAMIVDYLLDYLPARGIDPFRRIYNQVVQYADEYPERFAEIQNPLAGSIEVFVKYKKYFGWSTSATGATARKDLMSRSLIAAAKMTGTLKRDRKLILQTLGLVIRNGRVDHEDDSHDDLTFSWVLGFWLMSMGKNLSHYGIQASKVLQKNPNYLAGLKEVSAFQQSRNDEARRQVEELTEELRNVRDEYVARRLEYDLERAISRLSVEDRNVVTTDDLIMKLREERRKQRPSAGAHSLSQILQRGNNIVGNPGMGFQSSSGFGSGAVYYN